MMDRELHEVTCKVALYDSSKQYVLLAEYKPNEFGIPGGHLERDEEPDATLRRELKEELGITVNVACLAPLTFASHSYPDFHLLMPLYVCRKWEGTVTALEGQQLAWVKPNRLRDYEMPPADVPLVSHLMALL